MSSTSPEKPATSFETTRVSNMVISPNIQSKNFPNISEDSFEDSEEIT
jgi:hypothetical protein